MLVIKLIGLLGVIAMALVLIVGAWPMMIFAGAAIWYVTTHDEAEFLEVMGVITLAIIVACLLMLWWIPTFKALTGH